MPVDSQTLRSVMGRFATGVAVVTSLHEGAPAGMTANAIASVSLDPPLILFCAIRTSNTLAAVKASGRFVVNILHVGQEDLARRFAAPGPKSFDGIPLTAAQDGLPLFEDCVAWIDCAVREVVDGGDHEIVIGFVEAAGAGSGAAPLVFYESAYRTLG